MPNLTSLKRSQTIPFIDTRTSGTTATWTRIGRSSIFDLALNPNTVTHDYIENDMPTDEVTYYKPTLPLDLSTTKGDPAYDFIFDKFYNMPTGTALTLPTLIVFGGNACTSEDPGKAWQNDATLVLSDMNTVDGKIMFTLNFGGSITLGTVVITAGAPVFTSAAATPAGGSVEDSGE